MAVTFSELGVRGHSFVLAVREINLEVMKKVVPLHSHLKNGRPMRP